MAQSAGATPGSGIVSKYDKDSDQTLDLAEVKAAASAHFDKLDKDADGTLRHFYTAHPRMAEDIKERGIDLLTPVYNALDLTPQGRGNWYAKLDYGA